MVLSHQGLLLLLLLLLMLERVTILLADIQQTTRTEMQVGTG